MFRMSHLGPHTFPLARSHEHGHRWVRLFRRSERHALVEEDRRARHTVLAVLAGAMAAGLVLIVLTLLYVAWR